MLSPKERLKKGDLAKVLKKGKRSNGKYVLVKYLDNTLDKSRFAFLVSLKVSKKSTVRNKKKRQLREIVRRNLRDFPKGKDIIIIAKPEILAKNFKAIKDDLTQTLLNLS